MTGPTVGTHNTHDEAGRVTLFADLVGYTEAIPVKVRERLALARRGYRVRVCRRQRDLVFVARRKVLRIRRTRYVPVHAGRAQVSPHRGTFVIEGRRRDTRRRVAILLTHRVNAAHPPYVRGERYWRAARWAWHVAVDDDLAERYRARGWDVIALGDVNTPPDVVGFPALAWEIGHGFDRIASNVDLVDVEYLGRAGSDHPRLRARLAH